MLSVGIFLNTKLEFKSLVHANLFLHTHTQRYIHIDSPHYYRLTEKEKISCLNTHMCT